MDYSSTPIAPIAKRVVAGAGLVMVLLACGGRDPTNPGTQLGTFHVSAKLKESTCGATPDPWEFDVRINHEGALLYWIQGGLPIQGHVDSAAKTQLRTENTYDVRPADPKAKLAVCTLARADVLNVTLSNASAQPATDPANTASFVGGLVYTFTPTEGSDCDDQVAASGGGFDALPCVVSYDIAGTFKSPPK